jgi:hypothetical protein
MMTLQCKTVAENVFYYKAWINFLTPFLFKYYIIFMKQT